MNKIKILYSILLKILIDLLNKSRLCLETQTNGTTMQFSSHELKSSQLLLSSCLENKHTFPKVQR